MPEADYLELIDPAPVRLVLGGQVVEVWKCQLVDWFRLETVKQDFAASLERQEFAKAAWAVVRFVKIASGWSPSDMTAEEGLAALAPLWRLNELRYIDPYLQQEGREALREEWLDNTLLAVLEATLATRFSLAEIRDMYPEQALVMFQKIKEDEADDRAVLYYSTEFGYEQSVTRKGKMTKYQPRPSPYEVLWRRKRRIAAKATMAGLPAPPSPFIKSPEKVLSKERGKKDAKDKNRKED